MTVIKEKRVLMTLETDSDHVFARNEERNARLHEAVEATKKEIRDAVQLAKEGSKAPTKPSRELQVELPR